MSSQSSASAPASVYVAIASPCMPTANTRAVSPLSLCAHNTPSFTRLEANPESSMRSLEATVAAGNTSAAPAHIAAAAMLVAPASASVAVGAGGSVGALVTVTGATVAAGRFADEAVAEATAVGATVRARVAVTDTAGCAMRVALLPPPPPHPTNVSPIERTIPTPATNLALTPNNLRALRALCVLCGETLRISLRSLRLCGESVTPTPKQPPCPPCPLW